MRVEFVPTEALQYQRHQEPPIPLRRHTGPADPQLVTRTRSHPYSHFGTDDVNTTVKKMSVAPCKPKAQLEAVARSTVRDPSPRRFGYFAIAGVVIASIPYLWMLLNSWSGAYQPLRSLPYFSGFYDTQAQAIIHGHLWVPTGSLGLEGFVHGGRTYTYFGPLLALLRVPIILVAPSMTGRLTVPSMLVAWLLTGLFSSLLIWRVRVLLRGAAIMGRTEGALLGLLVTTIMGGSTLLFVGAAPWVYNEDIVWSVAITIATLFVFLGILDRPSRAQAGAAGALILAGILGRPTPGLACVVGAILIAIWFRVGLGHFGREEAERRRCVIPMLMAGLIPLAVASTISYLKFDTFMIGVPFADQVWTTINAHRRAFLAATGGKGYSLHFLPTTLWAYFQPAGLRVQSTFPFLTLPIEPPHVFGGHVVDIIYPTASVPSTMPLLFLSSCWAVVVTIRRRAARGLALMRIPFIVGVGAFAVDFLLGYIAPRFLADFLPFLVLGSAIGMVDIWRRCEHQRKAVKRSVVAAVIALALFSMAANIAIAMSPATEWNPTQAKNYLKAVRAVSNSTGHPLASRITRATSLPPWAPANEVYVVGNCDGLYLSSGIRYDTVPTFQRQRATWIPVEEGPRITHAVNLTFNGPLSQLRSGVPIMNVGFNTILIRGAGHGKVQLVLRDLHDFNSVVGASFKPKLGTVYLIHVTISPIRHTVEIGYRYDTWLSGLLLGASLDDPLIFPVQPPAAPRAPSLLTVERSPVDAPDMSLCRSLLAHR